MAERTSTSCGPDLLPAEGESIGSAGALEPLESGITPVEGVVTNDIVTVWIIDEERGRVRATAHAARRRRPRGPGLPRLHAAGRDADPHPGPGDERRDPPDVRAALMSGWFDKLLEELQRRQAEEDARREGRPIERNVTPIDEGRRASSRRGSNGGNGHGGGPPVARPIFGSGTPWRRWVLIGGGIVAVIIVLGLLGGVVNLITDVMWYDALDRRDVLQTRLWAQIALFGIGFFAMLVPVLVSVWLARRIAPQSPVRRLGDWELPDISRLVGLALVAIAVLLALGSGAAWSGAWETILLFFNGDAWGTTDPTLGRDIGFYVFDLPFWRFVLGWASTTLIIVGVLTLGGLRRPRAPLAVPPLGAGPGAPLGHRRAPAGGHRRRLPARHRGAGVLDSRVGRQRPGRAVHRHERAVPGLRDPHRRRARLGRAPAPEHLVPDALAARARRRRMVRALDRRRRPLSGLRPALPGRAERADRRAALHPEPHGVDARGVRPRRDRDAPLHR